MFEKRREIKEQRQGNKELLAKVDDFCDGYPHPKEKRAEEMRLLLEILTKPQYATVHYSAASHLSILLAEDALEGTS